MPPNSKFMFEAKVHKDTKTDLSTLHTDTDGPGYRCADAKHMHVYDVCMHQRVEDRHFNASE